MPRWASPPLCLCLSIICLRVHIDRQRCIMFILYSQRPTHLPPVRYFAIQLIHRSSGSFWQVRENMCVLRLYNPTDPYVNFLQTDVHTLAKKYEYILEAILRRVGDKAHPLFWWLVHLKHRVLHLIKSAKCDTNSLFNSS